MNPDWLKLIMRNFETNHTVIFLPSFAKICWWNPIQEKLFTQFIKMCRYFPRWSTTMKIVNPIKSMTSLFLLLLLGRRNNFNPRMHHQPLWSCHSRHHRLNPRNRWWGPPLVYRLLPYASLIRSKKHLLSINEFHKLKTKIDVLPSFDQIWMK